MRRALILAALLSLSAHAQSDKAQHLAVSTGLGLSIRSVTDSKTAAFWSTLAIGAAKEIADSQQAGNRFSSGDLLADVIGAGLATLGPAPDRVGVMGFSLHTSKTRHLNDFTPGLMLSWDAPQLPWDRGAVDVALYRNSQGFPGLYAGVSKEWRLSPRWYVGAGGGVTYGYRRYEHDVQMAGTVNRGVRFGCIPGLLCVYEVPGKARWQPAALLSARVQLDHGFSVTATYLPAGVIAKALNGNRQFLKDADAVSLWVSYRRKF